MDFIKNLSMHYNALPKQSRRLADFIRENPSKVIRMTAKALGEESGTSAAAVVRLCQQLGYGGLEQLKISLARHVSSAELNTPIDPIIAPGDSIPEIAQKLCHIETNTVQEALPSWTMTRSKRRSASSRRPARCISLDWAARAWWPRSSATA